MKRDMVRCVYGEVWSFEGSGCEVKQRWSEDAAGADGWTVRCLAGSETADVCGDRKRRGMYVISYKAV